MTNPIPSSSGLPVIPATSAGADTAASGPSFPTSLATGPGGAQTAAAGTAAPVVPPAAAAAVAGGATTAQVGPIVAAAQAALVNTVNVSAQAQQAIKLEAFSQLVTSLVNQIQPGQVNMPANWPAGGVTTQLQSLVTQLLVQATARQPLPQQLVSLQSWPAALTQSVLQRAGLEPSGNAAVGVPTPAGNAPAALSLPALQTWLVQQGVVQAQDGWRAFTLTLRVPVAWAQAQSMLGQALAKLPASGAAGVAAAAVPTPVGQAFIGSGQSPGAAGLQTGALTLPFSGSVQQLASGAMGLVMQPQVLPGSVAAAAMQSMRTSAILQLEFQPLSAATQTAQSASIYMPAHMLPQDVQALLQNRGTDPWLLMAQNQQDKQGQKQQKNANEQHPFCNRAGCQYQGRAVCAQPFCAEMNYLWSIDRARRR